MYIRGVEESLYTIKSLAAFLDVHPKTVRRMIERGEITHIRVASDVRFRKEHIEHWLERRTVKARA